MKTDEPTFTARESRAVEALLDEHMARAAQALKGATSEVQCDLDCLGESIRRWQPLADAEGPEYRPHQIAIGLMALRAKAIFEKTSAN